MSKQTFRTTPLFINDKIVFADSIVYQSQASLEPKFYRDQRLSNTYKAENYLVNTINVTYPITGLDVIKSYISNSSGIISGRFAGFYFTPGYLKSYNMSVDSNNKLVANAEIAFFQSLSGVANFFNTIPGDTLEIINSTNCNFSNVSGFDNADNIQSLNYQYEAELFPNIRSSESTPMEMRVGRQTTNTTIICDSNSGKLDFTGRALSMAFNCINQAGTIVERFNINGFINSVELNSQVGDTMSTKYNIIQNVVDPIAIITGFTPTTATYYATVRISGQYFNTINYAFFNDLPANLVTNNQDNLITVNVPPGALTGPLQLVTYDSIRLDAGTFSVTDPSITINSFYPLTGSYYI